MKNIPITQGKYAIVDDEDFPYLNRFLWCVRNDVENGRGYRVVTFIACYKEKSLYVSMGKFLVDNKNNDSFVVLHKNGNFLDFRKENLLLGSLSEKKIKEGKYNLAKVPTSKYKGVYKAKKQSSNNRKLWKAAIRKENVKYHLGYFYTEKEAAKAYNEKAKELYGDIAFQNKI